VISQQNYGGRDVKQHCRNLKNISLECVDTREKSAIATLLASYGEQLVYALLFDMVEVHLKEVADACPNARFHFYTRDMGVLFTGLNMFGSRIEIISNSVLEITENVDGWKNAWGKATTLRKLEIGIFKAGDAEAIFSTPKEHLKELLLCLELIDDAEDVKKVMDVCGNGTKFLETFWYIGRDFYRDTTKNFFEQNKDSLSAITICPTGRVRDEKLYELLNSFLELPAPEIVCLNYAIPNDILNALEKRGVYRERRVHWY